MTITDITKPVEKKFTLELNENELQMLGLVVGSISLKRLKSFFTDEDWRLESYPTITLDDKFVENLHTKIISITRKF